MCHAKGSLLLTSITGRTERGSSKERGNETEKKACELSEGGGVLKGKTSKYTQS